MPFYEAVAPPTVCLSPAYSRQYTDADGTIAGSAVCILETHSNSVSNKIRGLARMVQVSSNMTLVDLTINGLTPGKYYATVRDTGDISQGAGSTGGIWEAVKAKVLGSEPVKEPRGIFGSVEVNDKGRAMYFWIAR